MCKARLILRVCFMVLSSVGRTLIREYSRRVNNAAKARMATMITNIAGLVLSVSMD